MHDESRSTDSRGEPADWDAIARFAVGESDPAETARVQAWLAAHPTDARLLRLVSPAPAIVAERQAGRVDVEAALATVRGRIKAEGAQPALTVSRGTAERTPRERAVRAATGRRARMLAIAAALLLVAGYATERAVRRTVTSLLPTTAQASGLETPVGVRDSIVLSDGSRVVLAPGSRLQVSADFANSRLVSLEGAAYFEVVHDEEHPFTVRSGHAEIRDVGTAFSVNTDARGAVVVSVTEGVVNVRRTATAGVSSAAASPVELRAGDRGTVPAVDATVAVARGAVTPDDVAWTRGTLVFRDAPLSAVQADVRRWYGLELQIADSALAGRTLTASFRGEPADQIVRTIALALGAEAVQQGDTVQLRTPGPGPGTGR